MGTCIKAQQQVLQQDGRTASAAVLNKPDRRVCCHLLSRPGQRGHVWCCSSLSAKVRARLPSLSAHAALTTSLPSTPGLRTILRGNEFVSGPMTSYSTDDRSGDRRGCTRGTRAATRSGNDSAAVASLPSDRSSRRTSIRWKADDEAMDASLEHGRAYAEDDDEEPDPDHDPFTPSMPDDQHYDPHRDHRDRDHAALGVKHLNAARVDHERLKKHRVHKEIKRLRERKHDAVSRPEL